MLPSASGANAIAGTVNPVMVTHANMTQQNVQMGTIHSGPPPSSSNSGIHVYTHQEPIVHAIPMSNRGPSGYGQVSMAEYTKDEY
jgi:hypothetical protein